MPQKTWVIGEEVLATDFNTFVQNQVVPRFASVAARNAAWPAATAGPGAVCTTTDTGTLWIVVGAAWLPEAQAAIPHRFKLRSSGSSSASGAVAVVPWNSEVYDTDNGHDNATNNSRYTIPAGLGGLWSIQYNCDFAASSTGERTLYVRANGAGDRYAEINLPAAAATRWSASGSVEILLAAGDYVELVAIHTAVGTLAYATQSWNYLAGSLTGT